MASESSTVVFRKRCKKLDWRKIDESDLKEIEAGNVDMLQRNLSNVTFCNMEAEMNNAVPQNFIKAFQIAQYIIEYLMYCQEKSQVKIELMEKELETKNQVITVLSMARILCDKEEQLMNKSNKQIDFKNDYKHMLKSDLQNMRQISIDLSENVEVLREEMKLLRNELNEQRRNQQKPTEPVQIKRPQHNDSISAEAFVRQLPITNDTISETYTMDDKTPDAVGAFVDVTSSSAENTYTEVSSNWDMEASENFSLSHVIAKTADAKLFARAPAFRKPTSSPTPAALEEQVAQNLPIKEETMATEARTLKKLNIECIDDDISQEASEKGVIKVDNDSVSFLDSDRSDSSGSFLEIDGSGRNVEKERSSLTVLEENV